MTRIVDVDVNSAFTLALAMGGTTVPMGLS